jgi:hypothetical protein
MPMTIEWLLEVVFSVGCAPRLYNEDISWAAVSCQQFSCVKWCDVKQLVGEWVSSAVNWKPACEKKTRRLVQNSYQPGTQLSVHKSSAQAAVTRGSERRKLRLSLGRSCCQETANGECNRLRALVGVSDLWSVVPSSVHTWSINPFTNPYPIYSHTPLKRDII